MTRNGHGAAAGGTPGLFLVNIPFYHAGCAEAPLGLAYVAAVLERSGIPFELLDANGLGMSLKDILAVVREKQPAAVGATMMTSMLAAARELADGVKALPRPPLLIFGGPHPTIAPEEALERGGADICVRGEGEETILDLMARLGRGTAGWRDVPGISFRDKGEVVHTPDRPLIRDLDSIPFPARHLLPLDRYQTIHTGRKRFATLVTSRGCPGKCMFCFRPFGRNLRYRSMDNVMGEVRELVERFRVEEISILDDAFTLDRNRVAEFCDRVSASGLRFAWRLGNGTRVDLIDDELLKMMKRAGCYEVAFGIESGDDEVLRKIGKEITTAQVERAFAAAKRAGMETIGFFMIGHPFDTVETMRKTIDFAIRLDPTYAQFTMSTPLPGTALWTWVKKHGRSLIGDDVTKLDFLGATPHYETDGFTAADARRMYRRAYRRFYIRPRYIWRSIRRIRSLNDIVVLLKGLLYLRRI
ncbi:MAG: radical SAM protein [Chlamydiae bacterium]|nr:radical SAM protein [Chlamydiota bacterium]